MNSKSGKSKAQLLDECETEGKNGARIKVRRLPQFWTNKVRMRIKHAKGVASIAEFQLFNERK
jgi:alpha-L-fucosidase